ncbi:hypothetical protein F5Y15DRAFT_57924 [Xylariaceae sp. FL0016]|nr:hypothetical protein F5Y15DRAFT_57924 [Xylariaceae sp. FL0016]
MDQEDELSNDKVKLVATTGNVTIPCPQPPSPDLPASGSHIDSHNRPGHNTQEGSYFETAQWSADGTALLTASSSNLISGYIVPEDLLSPHASPLSIAPSAQIQLPEPTNVLAGAPYFTLAAPWTHQVIVSARDHPIQLFYLDAHTDNSSPSSSPSSFIGARDLPSVHRPPATSYPFLRARSETFLTATSLLWSEPGTHFLAGTRNLLARFDVARAGEPVTRIKTIPSERHISKGGGVGMRGTISTLSEQPRNEGPNGGSLIAAGTWSRWVGLYDLNVPEEEACVATWGIAQAAEDTKSMPGGVAVGADADMHVGIGGDGIMQTFWSPCGRYLFISERRSRGILVYDVRVTGRLLGWLSGREARDNQRIQGDVFHTQGGTEVWSGTTDGTVNIWEGVGSREGAHEPAWGWNAHGSTIGSTCLHQSGTVIATCAGSWEFLDDECEDSDTYSDLSDGSSESASENSSIHASWMRRRYKESSLKMWSLTNDQDEGEVGVA